MMIQIQLLLLLPHICFSSLFCNTFYTMTTRKKCALLFMPVYKKKRLFSSVISSLPSKINIPAKYITLPPTHISDGIIVNVSFVKINIAGRIPNIPRIIRYIIYSLILIFKTRTVIVIAIIDDKNEIGMKYVVDHIFQPVIISQMTANISNIKT